ncbi:MAG: hypothetical protein HOH74_04460, partial [Gemmatimonadetes bacterium]|nr:hypothetical protein [Gemmatimonadota bacterium]
MNPVTDIGDDRQLFLDGALIAATDSVQRRLHEPVRRERVIFPEHPWEQEGVSYMVATEEDGRFRAWYRVGMKAGSENTAVPRPVDRPVDMTYDQHVAQGGTRGMYAYAESVDGVHWVKPELGIVELDGSAANNLVWHATGNNMCPFRDPNPDVPEDERYKAIVRHHTVFGLVSPDGLHWRLMQQAPLLTQTPFDSHNIAFFDERLGEYVIYSRGVLDGAREAPGEGPFKGGLRWVRRWHSSDFRTWSEGELIDCGDTPGEQFYTNACIPYDRAPGTYLMFPSRFVQEREPIPDWPHGPGVSDIVFLSSRDGRHFDRSFMEAFIRPGPDEGNWHERAIYMERGLLHTSPTEMSLYGMENWRLPSVAIRRYGLRTDGFVSMRAGFAGGTFSTHPLVFRGEQLELNFATSAVGHVQVELQDASGSAIEGFSLLDSQELYGDRIAQTIGWRG